MANRHDIAHRFANKQAGKNGRISAGNVRYDGKNYYSYNTVFGQWADVEKNVCIVFEGSTSPSSSRHKLGKGLFPDDVHVFPYNDNHGGWYSYDGCDLMGWEREFTFKHRCILIDYYVAKIYNSLAAIKDGKKKGLENVSFEAWDYIEELCSLYKDTSINKYLKWTKNKDYKKLVRMLESGTREVPYLVDQLFGRGTWMQYWDYCARYRKQSDKREKMEMLCKRLGIGSPYVSYRGYHNRLSHEMSADDIRKLTAKERLDIHFKALAHKEYKKHEDERKKLYNKRKDNAYRWIVGFGPVIESEYYHSYKYCEKVRNMYTGEVYEVGGSHIFGFWWLDKDVSFDYNGFRKSEDKEQWIVDFYAKCKEVADNRKAIGILKRIKAHVKEKIHSWDDDVFINDDNLRENTTDAEYAICAEFIRKQDRHYAEEEARRRAEEIARLKREEEERKEREYMEQVKKEQIVECLNDGSEGCRNLWRKHLSKIDDSESFFNDASEVDKDGDFFYGGNVLLRLDLKKDKVETSKSIRIPVDTCKKMWMVVSKWHENPSCFKPMQIDTKGSGRYTISSYKNDILTAGCHKIAYTEMERMYNEIINA